MLAAGGLRHGLGSAAARLQGTARRAMGCAGSSEATRGATTGAQATEYAAYYVTVPSKKAAYAIARTLVESKLAACVNIIPGVESVYIWEDKVEKDQELLLMIKSRAGLLDKIVKRVKQEHEYDTPEVIAVPILGGSGDYLDWLKANTLPR
ncbi:divalent ion tolerance protein CutA [Chloropicon roscoffensis]|uniref:Divalent ion tolerance protein CutA n=1 Tax=Chloropicon roscoffensis TaxID=1461544 RepID=A0AAX4P7Q6_9CHLO